MGGGGWYCQREKNGAADAGADWGDICVSVEMGRGLIFISRGGLEKKERFLISLRTLLFPFPIFTPTSEGNVLLIVVVAGGVQKQKGRRALAGIMAPAAAAVQWWHERREGGREGEEGKE